MPNEIMIAIAIAGFLLAFIVASKVVKTIIRVVAIAALVLYFTGALPAAIEMLGI